MLESDLSPKSVVRDMYEWGRTFTEFIAYYGVTRSEGLVLRYLTDTYRALRQTVPERVKTEELDDIIEWLGETVRQTDSSLLDEWEALTDPESVARAAAAAAAGEPLAPPRPITANERAFRGDGPQRDVPAGAARRPRPLRRPRRAARATCRAAVDERRRVGGGARRLLGRARAIGRRARPPARRELLMIDATKPREWTVRQIIDDPEGNHDWAIVATVDLDASDAAGEPVIRTQSFSSGRRARPEDAAADGRSELDGARIELTPLAEAVAERYFAEFPEDLERYGDAAMPWEIHDTLHTLNWAVLDVAASPASRRTCSGWPGAASRATSRSSTSRAT